MLNSATNRKVSNESYPIFVRIFDSSARFDRHQITGLSDETLKELYSLTRMRDNKKLDDAANLSFYFFFYTRENMQTTSSIVSQASNVDCPWCIMFLNLHCNQTRDSSDFRKKHNINCSFMHLCVVPLFIKNSNESNFITHDIWNKRRKEPLIWKNYLHEIILVLFQWYVY